MPEYNLVLAVYKGDVVILKIYQGDTVVWTIPATWFEQIGSNLSMIGACTKTQAGSTLSLA